MSWGEGNAGSSRDEALSPTKAAVLFAAYLIEEVVNRDKLFNCRSIYKEKKEKKIKSPHLSFLVFSC